MLEVVHVTKRYRKVLANDDINLTIEDGRIGVLLGPNGAGKTTTMNMITGYIAATEGEVKVNGVVETQRGKKLFGGEVVEYNGSSILIKK